MSKIIDLTQFELVLATGLKARHGLCGHTYELIEYWWYFTQHGINAAILITSHSKDVLLEAAKEKYCFDENELHNLCSHTFDGTEVMLARLPTVLWVDGSIKYEKNAVVVSKKNIGFICNNSETLDCMDVLLGDTRIYDIPHIEHYVKKLLFTKFKPIEAVKTDTALLYCTIQARKVSKEYILSLSKRFKYKQYLIITNDEQLLSIHLDNILFKRPPLLNIFKHFDAYIYSPLKIGWAGAIDVLDCSPRFPAECVWYNKDVIIDAPINKGLAVRMYDCNNIDSITLSSSDYLIQYL